MSYIEKIDLSKEDEIDESKKALVISGERMFLILNHRNYLCIELQFFLMVLLLSGLFNSFSMDQSKFIITHLTLMYGKTFSLGLNFFKDIDLSNVFKKAKNVV